MGWPRRVGGGSRRGRQPSHHGAFGRSPSSSASSPSLAKRALNLAPPSSACAHQLPKACPALIRHTRTTLPSMLATCAHADIPTCSGSKRACAAVGVAGSESDGAFRATFLRRRGTPAFRMLPHTTAPPHIPSAHTRARLHVLIICADMAGTRLAFAAEQLARARGDARGRGLRGAVQVRAEQARGGRGSWVVGDGTEAGPGRAGGDEGLQWRC